MTQQAVRLGIVGAGGFTRRFHLPNFLKIPGVEVAVAGATAWPTELEELATAFLLAAGEFEQDLAAEDMAAAGPTSTAAHGTWHGLSHEVYEWLSGEEMEMDHEMDMGDGMPME